MTPQVEHRVRLLNDNAVAVNVFKTAQADAVRHLAKAPTLLFQAEPTKRAHELFLLLADLQVVGFSQTGLTAAEIMKGFTQVKAAFEAQRAATIALQGIPLEVKRGLFETELVANSRAVLEDLRRRMEEIEANIEWVRGFISVLKGEPEVTLHPKRNWRLDLYCAAAVDLYLNVCRVRPFPGASPAYSGFLRRLCRGVPGFEAVNFDRTSREVMSGGYQGRWIPYEAADLVPVPPSRKRQTSFENATEYRAHSICGIPTRTSKRAALSLSVVHYPTIPTKTAALCRDSEGN